MGISWSSLLPTVRWHSKPPAVFTKIITNEILEKIHMYQRLHDTGYIGQAPHFNVVNLFAFIIGIDSYVNCRTLHGAVADANAMKEYLQETLWIPEDHILTLLDGQATREAIIKAFQSLPINPCIRKGDPILIFFAGHGSVLRAPSAWHVEGKIQSILPYDCEKSSESTGILPIPDHTIGALIDNIAKEKGDNITVIFDCCFAGGGTRVDEDEEYVPRTEHLNPNVLVKVDNLDQDILEARHGALSKIFSNQGSRSHVLLAASGEAEPAYEHEGRGLFTSELLKTLKESVPGDVTSPMLKLSSASRICIGFNKERVIFDERVSKHREVGFPARLDSTGSLVVDAGQAHGVSHGVEFTLYDQRGTRLGTIKVDHGTEVESFHTKVTMAEADDWRSASSATLSRVGEVLFRFGQGWNSPMATETLRRMMGDGTSKPSHQSVKGSGEVRLEVAVENECVHFKVLDERTKRLSLTKLPYTATLSNIDRILNAAAHYYWYLHHMDNRSAANHNVDVNFYRLKEQKDEEHGVLCNVPDGSGPCQKVKLVDGLDVINIVITPDTPQVYGIKIENKTTMDLYLNAFLFNSDLSILPYCIQSSDVNPEAPLKKNGSMTIGYGSSGERPFQYWLPSDQEVDVGFLKLFFATQPINLTDIQQVSPFENEIGCNTKESMGGPKVVQATQVCGTQDCWFTEMIPIVQRKHGA